MLLNIVFSFNRAMQLDCFLESFVKHFGGIDYKVAVIFHTTGKHSEAYSKLLIKYKDNLNISFYERTELPKIKYYIKILPLLLLPRNLYRFLKYPYLRGNVDDFKFLMEKIIRESKAKYLMFSTDDTFYDNDVVLNNEIFSFIDKNPKDYSYRLCLGKNLYYEKVPNITFTNGILQWDYNDSKNISGWRYPFIVDATIYDRNTIYKLIRKVLYHMPATLESFVNTLVVKKKVLQKGLAPEYSCVSNIWLNRVQKLGHHDSINIDVDFLNEKYLEGFSIVYFYTKPVNKWGIEPYKVVLKKGKIEEVIYEKS